MIYRLMLVEDEPPAMRGIVRAIEKCPTAEDVVIVGQAFSGTQALEMIPKTAPHLILSDVKMPVMDGFELAARVRALYPDIQMAILSGHQDFEYVQRALRYSLSDYLLKPIDPEGLEQLLVRMKQTVRRKAGERMGGFLAALAGGQPGAQAPEQDHPGYLVALVQSGPDDSRARRLGLEGSAALPPDGMLEAARQALNLQDVWATPAGSARCAAVLAGLEDGRAPDDAALVRFASLLPAPLSATLVYQAVGSPGEVPAALDAAHRRLREALIPGQTQILRLDQPLPPAAPALLTPQQEGLLSAALKLGRAQALQNALRQALTACLAPGVSQRRVEGLLDQAIALLAWQLSGSRPGVPALLETAAAEAVLTGRDGDAIVSGFSERAAALLCPSGLDDNLDRTTEAMIGRIHRYIESHFDQPVEMQSLAARHGISDSYLSTLYKKRYSLSPQRHLVTLRIERAKALILSGADLPFRVIAQMVGYDDPHYFSRLFRSETGCSPSDYKARNASGPR
jgi:AraC-like DNA-binding protein/CheY-like chemotaxis protein